MSTHIVEETVFLYNSILMGVFVSFIYDIIRIFRRVVSHNRIFLSIEDLGYWMFCAWEMFCLLYRESNGVLRWFAILGVALGMALYLLTVSRFFVTYVSKAIKKLLSVIGKLISFLMRPFKKAAQGVSAGSRKAGRGVKRAGSHMKKKLTDSRKLFKMIICKK